MAGPEDLPTAAQTSTAFLYLLLTVPSVLLLENYLRQNGQDNGFATSRVKRSWYHATGLLCRAGLLYGGILLCEMLWNVHVVDAGTFVELIAFDFGVIAYSSLA